MIRTITSAAADLRAGRVSGWSWSWSRSRGPSPSTPRSGARALGPLDGIALGVKDIFAETGGPTTAQSPVLDRAWACGGAPAVARLKQAGGIVLGKLSTMEFALGVPEPRALRRRFTLRIRQWGQRAETEPDRAARARCESLPRPR